MKKSARRRGVLPGQASLFGAGETDPPSAHRRSSRLRIFAWDYRFRRWDEAREVTADSADYWLQQHREAEPGTVFRTAARRPFCEPDPASRSPPRPTPRTPLDPLHHRARKARDEAMESVEVHADPQWQVHALNALRVTAEARVDFISDDVWEVSGLTQTRDNRALGPIFRDAIRKGWIRKTATLRPSVRSHLSGKPVWESLIFKGTEP